MAEKAVRLGLNVVVGFWVARYLGAERFGALGFALALVGIALVVVELGLDGVVRREIARRPEGAPSLIATTWGLRLLSGGIAAAVLGVLALTGWGNEREQRLVMILSLTLFQPALWVSDAWFQARLRARVSAAAQFGGAIVGTALRIGLILGGGSLAGFAWAAVVEMTVAVAWLMAFARREGCAPRLRSIDSGLAGRLLRESWPLMLAGVAVILYIRTDTVMVRMISGQTAAGIYTAATRLTELWFFVPGAVAASALPALLRARERGTASYEKRLQAYFDLNAAIAYALAVPLVLGAQALISVAYGAEYGAASPVLAIHGWSLVFVFLGVARGQYLVNEGFSRFYLASTLAGLLVNVGLNALLIPRYGAPGAAGATVAAQAVAAWISTFCFAPARKAAWMQTRAVFIPVTWIRYLRHG